MLKVPQRRTGLWYAPAGLYFFDVQMEKVIFSVSVGQSVSMQIQMVQVILNGYSRRSCRRKFRQDLLL